MKKTWLKSSFFGLSVLSISLITGCSSVTEKNAEVENGFENIEIKKSTKNKENNTGEKLIVVESKANEYQVLDELKIESRGHYLESGKEKLDLVNTKPVLSVYLPPEKIKLSLSFKKEIKNILDRNKRYVVNGKADYIEATHSRNLYLANKRMEIVYKYLKKHNFDVERGNARVIGKIGNEYRVAVIEEVLD